MGTCSDREWMLVDVSSCIAEEFSMIQEEVSTCISSLYSMAHKLHVLLE